MTPEDMPDLAITIEALTPRLHAIAPAAEPVRTFATAPGGPRPASVTADASPPLRPAA